MGGLACPGAVGCGQETFTLPLLLFPSIPPSASPCLRIQDPPPQHPTLGPSSWRLGAGGELGPGSVSTAERGEARPRKAKRRAGAGGFLVRLLLTVWELLLAGEPSMPWADLGQGAEGCDKRESAAGGRLNSLCLWQGAASNLSCLAARYRWLPFAFRWLCVQGREHAHRHSEETSTH